MNYLDILNEYKQEMIAALGELVAYPSVAAEAVRTADGEVLPFGRSVHDVYVHTLKLGDAMGMSSFNAHNYGGHIELRSDTDNAETLGIIAHLDVVPGGSGWTGEAFKLEERDGFLYGRGVSDDKGPLVACLYAMKAIKESGAPIKKNIRLILGLDEDVGCSVMAHYLEAAGAPDMGFTPDADFPLVNGEKGILDFNMGQKLTRQSSKDGLRLTKLEAGTASNAVAANARAVITGDASLYGNLRDKLAQYVMETEYRITGRRQGSSYVLEAEGVAAHGAHPEKGLNAVSVLMDFLGRVQFINEELNDFIAFYNDKIGFKLHGEGLGCELSDEQSGKLSFNVGKASINEDYAQISVNVRYPVSCTADDVYKGIETSLENSRIGLIKKSDMKPIYMDIDNPLVETLIGIYRDETGDTDAMPYVIGGGTYAKFVPNTLAYGALFPGEEDTMHQVDERVSTASFFKMARIYARAIYSICCE